VILDIPTQFAKLCPYRPACLGAAQMLDAVDAGLAACKQASASGHWTYDFNRHVALAELRRALVDEILARRAA
jgi:hypothetical protein